MESDAEVDERRNDVLSQSYIQGVERVAQQNNNDTTGFTFDLPKEVLEKREKAWGNLFDKYIDETPDEIVLDIRTMEPVTNEEEKDNEDDDDEDIEEDDDEQQKEYYSKCRAPMRKLPALIQYWIDTGNPPYQLVGEDDNSETGSSLSEGEHSRSGQSAVLREFSDRQNKQDENSPCSSVDTAAYILSNTNITKKAETVAIVEAGGKKFDKKVDNNGIETIETNLGKTTDKNISARSKKLDEISIDKARKTNNSALIMTRVVLDNESPLLRTRERSVSFDNLDYDENDEIFSPNKVSHDTSLISQQNSVKLSEILPAIQQFDELIETQCVSQETPIKRSALSKVRRKRKTTVSVNSASVKANGESQIISQPSQDSTTNLSQNCTNKALNRRKLYTGRNSPIDLIVATTSTDNTLITGKSLHPALHPVAGEKNQTTMFANRVRVKRKRKRASQRQFATNEEIQSQDENIHQERNITNERYTDNDKGHMRYTDFFESLGLTPSKTIIEKAPIFEKPSMRTKEKGKSNKRGNNVANKHVESTESSIKESQNVSRKSDNCVLSPEFVANSAKLLGDKIARVEVVRLSDKSLMRNDQRDLSSNEHQTESSSSSSHHHHQRRLRSRRTASKKERVTKTQNIEVLTTVTHDSDSSTILICSCNNNNNENSNNNNNNRNTNNDEYSASDYSFSTADSTSQDKSLPMKKDIISRSRTKDNGNDVVVTTIGETFKMQEHDDEPNTRNSKRETRQMANREKTIESAAFVRLEKLPLKNSPPKISSLSTSGAEKKKIPQVERPLRRANGRWLPKSSSVKAKQKNFFRSSLSDQSESEMKNISIGQRISGEANKIEIAKKSEENSTVCKKALKGLSLRDKKKYFCKRLSRSVNGRFLPLSPNKSEQNLFGSCMENSSETENKCITIGSRIFGQSSEMEDAKKTNENSLIRRDIFNLGILSQDEEDDDFIKLLRQGGSTELDSIDNEENHELLVKDASMNQVDGSIGEKLPISVARRFVNAAIGMSAFSSDEENHQLDKLRKNVRQRESRRTIDSIGSDATRNRDNGDVGGRPKDKIDESSSRNFVENDQHEDMTNNRRYTLRRSSRKRVLSTQDEPQTRTKDESASRSAQTQCESNDEKCDAQIGQKEKKRRLLKEAIVDSLPQIVKRSNATGLPRFQTKLDPLDSDSDFENSLFSINDQYNSRLRSESIEREILLPNSMKKLVENTKSEKKADSKNGLLLVQRDEILKKVTTKFNNPLPWQNKTHPPNGKTKKRNKSNNESKILSLRVIPCSPIKNHINEESRYMSVMRKESSKSNNIGTPIDHEKTEDGGESIVNDESMNFSTRLANEKNDNDESLSKIRQISSKNLFSHIFDDTIEGVDVIFGTNGNSRVTRSRVSIENLNFAAPKDHDNLTNMKQSTVTFRTRLSMESDEDNVS